MKKYLPKKKGFTLVELMVVISIIAMLSLIGFAVFTGAQKSARDAKRRGDVDAISKAYEQQYPKASLYSALTAADFNSGSIPKPPEGGDYYNVLATDGSGYKVCAALEGNTNPCNTDGPQCTCRISRQSAFNGSSGYSGTGSQIGYGGNNLIHPSSCDTTGTLANQLVAYWRMDESSWNNDCSTLTVNDSTSNASNGKSCPATTGSTTPVAGKFSNAGNFDGSNDYIDMGTSSLFQVSSSASITISLWIKKASGGGASWRVIFGRSKNDVSAQHWGYRLSIADINNGDLRLGGQTDLGPTPNLITDNTTFHHIVAVISKLSGTVYVDGVLKMGPSSLSGDGYNSGSGSVLTLGKSLFFDGPFNGQIDDVRVYSRILTAAEITSLYNGGNGCIP